MLFSGNLIFSLFIAGSVQVRKIYFIKIDGTLVATIIKFNFGTFILKLSQQEYHFSFFHVNNNNNIIFISK